MTAYSYSRIDLYEKCPWAYKLAYLEGVPRASSEALQIGKITHERIAGYLEHLIHKKYQTDWQWAEKAQVANADAQSIWEKFYQNFTLPQMEAPGVENKLGFDRNWKPVGFFDPDVYFRGVIDFHFRQDQLAVIVDWKTNRQIPESVEKNLQLRAYGWGVKRAIYPDAEEILLKLHFLRYGVERQVLLSPDDLKTVPDEITRQIAKIEADTRFEPTPGSFCGWCGLTAHCPIMANALVPVELVAPANQDEAQEAATLLLALRVMSQELTGYLKGWVQENGPITVGDLVYGPKTYQDYDLDAQTVVQALLEEGLTREEIWPLLSVTKTNLERGLRKLKRKNLINSVLATAKVSPSVKIEFHKGGTINDTDTCIRLPGAAVAGHRAGHQ